MPDKISYEKEHRYLAYSELWKASRDLFNIAKKTESERPSLLLSSFVTLAFSYEAYLNHLGEIYLKHWEYLERRTWKEKTNMIGEEFSIALSSKWGSQPLQSVDTLFRVRDKIAHGRTVALQDSGQIIDGELDSKYYEELKPNWFQTATNLEVVSEIRRNVESVMRKINDARPDQREPLFYSGITEWTQS